MLLLVHLSVDLVGHELVIGFMGSFKNNPEAYSSPWVALQILTSLEIKTCRQKGLALLSALFSVYSG